MFIFAAKNIDMDNVDITQLSEEDIKLKFITPAIMAKGWDINMIRMEFAITDGRVIFQGNLHARQTPKRADYVLFERDNYPIAVVEAKDAKKSVGAGIQQAIDYSELLDVKFAYSSNGTGFVEHDFITGGERNLQMDEFPTLDELKERKKKVSPLNVEQEEIINTPYYSSRTTHEPRYYQRIAINRAVEAVARGQQRILIVMATGTGKTFTAFQILYRLHKNGTKKKILYLADRNVLVDQTIKQDFSPFKKVMSKVKDSTIDTAYEVYMALYQQLIGKDGKEDPFKKVGANFFDLIVVDECHRGSAREDSEWRRILEYFGSATQIGMTATPKAIDGANNIDYFGKAIYTYSLLQGIIDGFLAPYRVTRVVLNYDESGWSPEVDERDIHGNLIENKNYIQRDFGRAITFTDRHELVSWCITNMLREIGPMTKTIVFCPDIQEAETMRQCLINQNTELCKEDSRYIMKITGDDIVGKKQLDNFIDVNSPYPVIVTTSDLLATGVDCKTCGLIVIDKEISSMIEFKQIIGRGTRLRTDKGKWHLEILDFRGATQKFFDPEFDAEPLPPPQKCNNKSDSSTRAGGTKEPKLPKYTVNNVDFEIAATVVYVLDANGERLTTESINAFTKRMLETKYESLDDFISTWINTKKKISIYDDLKDMGVLIDALKENNKNLENADLFDTICFLAFDIKPLTRQERAKRVKDGSYLENYSEEARQVLEALLDQYVNNGIFCIESDEVLKYAPFDAFGKPQKISKLFGGKEAFKRAIKNLEKEIYKTIA